MKQLHRENEIASYVIQYLNQQSAKEKNSVYLIH